MKKVLKLVRNAVLLFFGVAVACGVVAGISESMPAQNESSQEVVQAPAEQTDEEKLEEAKTGLMVIFRNEVKERLAKPKTAKFPEKGEHRFQILDNGNYQIKGYCDSENALGTIERTHWTLEINYQDMWNYELMNIEVEQ